ncbi:tRNA pseudouridine synthase-like 1 isoform X2 [Esox lucius]|nr:tRNA pseudouridine synthase-like 1 isoform X2 [Esox lucius]
MKAPPHQAVKGVQNYLEEAVRRLRPANAISLHVSSRTDTGVHAICNSAHFDLQRQNGKPPLAEEVLVDALNFHLRPESIRVTHAHRVHGAFHARFQAVSRTYVYRLAMGIRHHSCMPLTEDKLCWGIRSVDLDIGAMRDAAALLVGTHNFSSFRALNSETPYKDPVKTLDRASLEPGDAFVRRHFHRGIQFWELTFRSRSFLYKQVRRMTGALVAVGQGKMSVYGVKELLEAQDSLAYPQNLTAPPDGLFLARVDYDPLDLPPHTQDDSYS